MSSSFMTLLRPYDNHHPATSHTPHYSRVCECVRTSQLPLRMVPSLDAPSFILFAWPLFSGNYVVHAVFLWSTLYVPSCVPKTKDGRCRNIVVEESALLGRRRRQLAPDQTHTSAALKRAFVIIFHQCHAGRRRTRRKRANNNNTKIYHDWEKNNGS